MAYDKYTSYRCAGKFKHRVNGITLSANHEFVEYFSQHKLSKMRKLHNPGRKEIQVTSPTESQKVVLARPVRRIYKIYKGVGFCILYVKVHQETMSCS
jgi:hypothetical protein